MTRFWKRLLGALAAVTFILAPVTTMTACGGEAAEEEDDD